MRNRCLYCCEELGSSDPKDFHKRCSLRFFGTEHPPQLAYSLNQMAALAKNVVERRIAVPGVQPKLSLSLGGSYILKPPSGNFPEMPQNEHVTMRIAEAFGIRTVLSSLIRLQSGELSYITRRLDRTNVNEKIHIIDMFQVLEAFDKYKGSMEKVGKAIGTYSNNTLLDKLFFFELTVFSFLTGNKDMHLKNFSLLKRGDIWALSPAYDLLNVSIANLDDGEELALSLEGKKKKLKKEHFERLGENLELNRKQIDGVFKRFIRNKKLALAWIKNSFLSEEFQEKYVALLEKRYSVFMDK